MLSCGKMLRKNLMLLFLIFLIAVSGTRAEDANYIGLNNKELKTLVPSGTRKVFSLEKKWLRSYDEDRVKTNLPYSDPNNRRVIFEKKFNIPPDLINKHSWQLLFLGIDDEVEIYFNNSFIGKRFGGMIPFKLDIDSKYINKQTNTLKLVVSPAQTGSKLIKEQNVFVKKVYTGVIREVLLIATPRIWINHVKYDAVKVKDGSDFDVASTIDISSGKIGQIFGGSEGKDSLGVLSKEKTKVTVEAFIKSNSTGNIVARGKPQIVQISSERTVQVDFDFSVGKVINWSPDNPITYDLVYRIMKNNRLIDELSTTIGFRDIEIKKEDNNYLVFVNGHSIKLKGIDYIEDYYKAGQTITAAQMKKDIEHIRELGANLIRFKYHVPHPYMASLCNEYGLFMFIELPIYNVPKSILTSKEIHVRMENSAKMMINAYDSYPSLLAWGISEGAEEGVPEVVEFSKTLVALIDSNSSKFIYKNIFFGSEDIYHDGFDLIGISDHNKYRSLEDIQAELSRLRSEINNKPVFVNYGVPIEIDNHNGYSDPLSIESQAYYITNLYDYVNSNNFAGSLVWSYNDYKLQNPLMIINNDDKYLCTSGIVDQQRKERPSFKTLQALFNEEKEPLLDAGKYSEGTPLSFIIVGIILALILVFLINRYRRFREYLTRAVLRPYNFYADIRDQRIMSTLQTVALGLGVSVTLAIFISSIFYSYRISEFTQFTIMLFIPWNGLRETIFDLVWIPQLSILLLSLFIFANIFLVSGIIKLFSFFVRARIFYTDTITITVWSGVPALILLPFAIILTRLLVLSPFLVYLMVIFLGAILIWILFRVYRSTAVVFDVPALRAYIIGIVFVGVILTVFFMMYDHDYSFFAYFQYLMQVMLNT